MVELCCQMRVLFNFTHKNEVFIDKLYNYYEELLLQIILASEIFVVTFPGSYTGIRKSIAIVKAIEVARPHIKTYGINLLKGFGVLFSNPVFYAEKHIISCYEDGQIVLKGNPEDVDGLGNIPNKSDNIIDFSTSNIYKHLDRVVKLPIQQEYYDKFNN